MKFNLKKPCKNCPFRKDSEKSWLGKKRAEGIAETITSGKGTFSCHKTTGVVEGVEVPQSKQSHCFGALQMLRNMDSLETGFIFQMAERLLSVSFEGIKKDFTICFENDTQFIEHHT